MHLWGLCLKLVALGLLASAVAQAETDWGEVLLQARHLRSEGRTQEAEKVLLTGWKEAERSHANSQWVASLCHHLGLIYLASARYDESERFFTRALRNWKLTASSNPMELVTTANGLVALYLAQRRFDRTEALFRSEVAKTAEALPLGRDNPEWARWQCNWASVLFYRGRYAEAEPIYKEALRIWEIAFGPDSPDVITALNNLGSTYLRMKQLDDALRCFERIRSISERRHLVLPRPLLNLAGVYTTVHRQREAEAFYLQAVQEIEAVNGPDHPLMAKALEQYAGALRQWNRKSEAARLNRRAKSILERCANNEQARNSVDLSELATR